MRIFHLVHIRAHQGRGLNFRYFLELMTMENPQVILPVPLWCAWMYMMSSMPLTSNGSQSGSSLTQPLGRTLLQIRRHTHHLGHSLLPVAYTSLLLVYGPPELELMKVMLPMVPTRRVVMSIYVHLMSYSLTKTLACNC